MNYRRDVIYYTKRQFVGAIILVYQAIVSQPRACNVLEVNRLRAGTAAGKSIVIGDVPDRRQ
jgi:hypothetical protein